MGGLKTETSNSETGNNIWGGLKTETGNFGEGGLKTETGNSETGNNIWGGCLKTETGNLGGGHLKTETGNFLLHFQNSKLSNRCWSIYDTDIIKNY